MALVGFGSAPARAGGTSEELLPDLVTLPITKGDLIITKRGRQRHLRLTNEVGNRGRGPLEVGSRKAVPKDGCAPGEFAAIQRIYGDTNRDGEFGRSDDMVIEPPTRFGCMEFHDAPAHHHWHVLDFAGYRLVRQRNGRRVAGRKIGFCLVDSRWFVTPPGFSNSPFYGGSCGNTGTPPEREGISVGWADVYGYSLPGQALRITRRPRGRYCLISTADPRNLILEGNEANNVRRVKLRLNPRKRRVERLKGSCRRMT
jgi:hypothetical protein